MPGTEHRAAPRPSPAGCGGDRDQRVGGSVGTWHRTQIRRRFARRRGGARVARAPARSDADSRFGRAAAAAAAHEPTRQSDRTANTYRTPTRSGVPRTRATRGRGFRPLAPAARAREPLPPTPTGPERAPIRPGPSLRSIHGRRHTPRDPEAARDQPALHHPRLAPEIERWQSAADDGLSLARLVTAQVRATGRHHLGEPLLVALEDVQHAATASATASATSGSLGPGPRRSGTASMRCSSDRTQAPSESKVTNASTST